MAIRAQLVAETLDEEKVARIMLTPKGIDSYHRLAGWIKETMDGVRYEPNPTLPKNVEEKRLGHAGS